MQQLAVFVNCEQPIGRVRVSKLVAFLQKSGISFHLFKFGSYCDNKTQYSGIAFTDICSSFVTRFPRPLQYVFWILALSLWCANKTNRRSTIYALGLDSALPLVLMGARNVIFDNADNFFMSKKWPKIVAYILKELELFVVQRCRIHLVPSFSRLIKAGANEIILPNTPSRVMLEQALSVSRDRNYESEKRLSLYVNGWLVDTRGIPTLVESLKWIATNKMIDFNVIVAGQVCTEAGRELLTLKCVEYLGVLSPVEALATYFRCNLVYSAYDPKIAINIRAEPNKWWDCVATGRPFLCNNEVITLEYFFSKGVCLAFPYYDYEALANLLCYLAEHSNVLAAMQDNIRRITWRCWDEGMAHVLNGEKYDGFCA